MKLVKPETAPYFQAFRERRRTEPGWLAERRERAIERFAEAGFPTRRDEAWRFTDLRPLERQIFPPAAEAAPAVAAEMLAPYRLGEAGHRIVLVNGRFAPSLSEIGPLPEGAYIGSLAAAVAERPELVEEFLAQGGVLGDQPFAALNAALFADGVVIVLPEGAVFRRPIEIVHWTAAEAPASVHGRCLVLAGARSCATLVESFAGSGAAWTNVVAAIRVGPGAALDHVILQAQPEEAIHLAASEVEIAEDGRYDSFLLTLGGRLSRQDLVAMIAGKHAFCGVGGAYLLRGAQEATIATLIDHAAPASETREVVKGVVEDRAHGVFQGKIRVRQEAQKTDAHQLNKNLLLSPRAAIDTKPELEIFADDVKCSHGATVGDLDETALFYLRSRGLDEATARRMLIEAFAAETLALVTDEGVRAYLRRHLDRWLADRKG